MTPQHRAPETARLTAVAHSRWLPLGVGIAIGAILFGGAGVAVARATMAADQVACPAGQSLVIAPGLVASCVDLRTPTPSPTVTPSASPTASPTPSPTATTTPATFPLGCRTRLAECGYPHEGNTGVPVGTVLTPINGNLTIRAGGTWQDLEVIGCVEVATSEPVIIRRLKVHPPVGGECMLGNIHHEGAGNILIEDTTSFCAVAKGHGFWVSNTTALRVRTYGCENGFELNANSTVRRSLVSGSENGGNDPHGDGIQSQGGDNVTIEGNTLLQGAITSAIITNPDRNRNWKIRGNFLGGGAYTLYCPENGKAGWEVTGNRFIQKGQPGGPAYGSTDACGGLPVWGDNNPDVTSTADNRYDHNGAAVSAT